MPFEREPLRPRSASDPTVASRGAGTPGKRTLTEDLPARPASASREVSSQGRAAPRVPRLDLAAIGASSEPPSPEMVALPPSPVSSEPPSPAMVALPPSPASSEPPSPEMVALPPSPVSSSVQDPLDAAEATHRGEEHDPDLVGDGHGAPIVEPEVIAEAGIRSSDYYKSVSYLTAAFGTLVSAIGWILLRQFPLMQPVGQALASGMKNGFGALDDAHKGNRPKAIGQTISAGGQGVAMAGVIAASKHPGAAQLPGVRAAGAGLNGVGMVFSGIGEAQSQNPAKAASNFVAAALNMVGLVGYTVEAANSLKPAFLALEGANNFNNSATPLGGAIDDGRKSTVGQPWLKDPKVVGQEITDLGLALSAIASTLNKIFLTNDKEDGTSDSKRFASLIMALGAVGMFLATVGYGISAMAERPKKPRTADVELAPVAPS